MTQLNDFSSLVLSERAAINIELLSSWLLLGDVGRLDSAFCNTSCRIHLLELISDKRVILNNPIGNLPPTTIEWIHKRVARINHAWIMPEYFKENKSFSLEMFLKQTGYFLKNIYIRFSSDEHECIQIIILLSKFCPYVVELAVSCNHSLIDISALFNTYRNLIKFDCGFISELSLAAMCTNCPKLETLYINPVIPNGSPSLKMVSQCSGLRVLNMERFVCKAHTEALVHIAQHCPLLEDIQLCFITEDVLLAMAQGCPRMVSCSVETCDLCSAETLLVLAQHWGQLRHLYLCAWAIWEGDWTDVAIDFLLHCRCLLTLSLTYSLHPDDADKYSQYLPRTLEVLYIPCVSLLYQSFHLQQWSRLSPCVRYCRHSATSIASLLASCVPSRKHPACALLHWIPPIIYRPKIWRH